MSQWRGRIFLDAGLILYVGPGSTADRHSHHAVQLVWSLDAPFEVELEGDRMARHAVLIWCDDVLSTLGIAATSPAISSVTRRAIAYIEQALDGVPRVSDDASALHLSPTRITHLFSKEVASRSGGSCCGRVSSAVAAFQAGNDLSTSAIAAGFSDSAHFSRTFRALFGLSPSLVLPIAELTGTIWSEPSG